MSQDSRWRVLITGASGFVGANLSYYFQSKSNFDVLGAVGGSDDQNWRLQGLLKAAPSNFRRASFDLRDRKSVSHLLTEFDPHFVVNCAAFGAYPSQSEADRIYDVNFSGVRYLLDSAKELQSLRCFLQLGSSSEYGLNCEKPSEEDFTEPDSDYAVAKVGASALVQYYANRFDLPAWVFRLYSVYGPYEETSRLIPVLLESCASGKLPPLAAPEISRDFIHVDDVCSAVSALFESCGGLRKGRIYNVGSGKQTKLKDIAKVSQKVFRISEAPKWSTMQNRKWDHPNWYGDVSRAKSELKWAPRVDLGDGLRRTSDWMRENSELFKLGKDQSVKKA